MFCPNLFLLFLPGKMLHLVLNDRCFKAGFSLKILGFFGTQYAKDYLMCDELQIMQNQLPPTLNWDNLKTVEELVWWGVVGDVSWRVGCIKVKVTPRSSSSWVHQHPQPPPWYPTPTPSPSPISVSPTTLLRTTYHTTTPQFPSFAYVRWAGLA